MSKIKKTDDNESFRDACEAQEQLIRNLFDQVDIAKEGLRERRHEYDEAVLSLRRMAGERLDRPLLAGEESNE